MSYQQPPGGGFPPGYQQPQQPQSQGYPMTPYAAPSAGSSSGLIQLIGLGLIALGLLLRGIAGLINPGSGAAFKMGQVAGMFISFGLLGLFYVIVNWGREKDLPTAVRVAAVAGAIVVVLPLVVWLVR